MRPAFHAAANLASRKLARALLAPITPFHVWQSENMNRAGAFLLAANHISHFDPPLISVIARRKIDWMALAEFFPVPLLGAFLRAVDAFPIERARAESGSIRTALARLKAGRVVGIFPEGGIRHGPRSVLEGAPLRAGAAALAHLAKVPIVPCVILGTDRLYAKKSWLPLRRTPVWIAFGDPIAHPDGADKSAARAATEAELAAAFRNLYATLRAEFALTAGDLPHSPQDRMHRAR